MQSCLEIYFSAYKIFESLRSTIRTWILGRLTMGGGVVGQSLDFSYLAKGASTNYSHEPKLTDIGYKVQELVKRIGEEGVMEY